MDERDVDWGATGRRDEYRFALVDPFTLADVGEAQAEAGASSLTWGYYTDNQLQGTIDMAEGDYRQDGHDRMVRVYHKVTVGGFSKEYTMATMFVSTLSNASRFGTSRRSLSCYGPLWRATQDVLARDFVRHAGDNVVQCIKDVVEYDGGVVRVGEGVDSSRAHTVDVFFPVGKNRAEVLNEYAGWIGCEIATGRDGAIVLRRYEAPTDKDPVYRFEEGVNCVYLPGIDWETARDEPVNRVVAYFSRESKQDDDPYPLSDSVYVDLPAASDYSYERSGRRRTHAMEVTEPCSHEELEAQARRYLDGNSADALYIEVEHAGVPFLDVGDVVEYCNPTDFESRVDVRCLVTEMSVQSLSPFCMTKTKMRVL